MSSKWVGIFVQQTLPHNSHFFFFTRNMMSQSCVSLLTKSQNNICCVLNVMSLEYEISIFIFLLHKHFFILIFQYQHTRMAGHSSASTISACELSFATFIFDGQSNVLVQMLRFRCVKIIKINHVLENYFSFVTKNL